MEEIVFTGADWERLTEMRADFLDATDVGGSSLELWNSRRDLEIYDATFGARIGWKWNAVLQEISRRGIVPPEGTILDWACGTGVAARAWLRHFGPRWKVHAHDLSNDARAFALERVRDEHPSVETNVEICDAPDVLLVSHVIDELDVGPLDDLILLARRARFVVWVEAGAKNTARALSAQRERLLEEFEPLAPCTHANACGILTPDHERDWCHHFAKPDQAAFTTRHWAMFSRTLKIDMRSLPYSYLVLQRRTEAVPRAAGWTRVLGRPGFRKGRALLDACDAEGVRALSLLERTDKLFFRALENGDIADTRYKLEVDGTRVKSFTQG